MQNNESQMMSSLKKSFLGDSIIRASSKEDFKKPFFMEFFWYNNQPWIMKIINIFKT